MPRYDALPVSLPPRGLSREAAAQYVGISPVKFDEMVNDGRMPRPKRIDSRKVWDRRALDLAFDGLSDDAGTSGMHRGSWDDYLQGTARRKATGWEDFLADRHDQGDRTAPLARSKRTTKR
jgi:hypothetical protein